MPSIANSIFDLKFNMVNETSVVFQNGSNNDYHFIIKELRNEFNGKFECLGENTEKHKTFSVSIEKEVIKIDKNGNESVLNTCYKKIFYWYCKIYGNFLIKSCW